MKVGTALVIIGAVTGFAGTGFAFLAAKKIPEGKRYSPQNVIGIALPAAGGIAGTYFLLTRVGKTEA